MSRSKRNWRVVVEFQTDTDATSGEVLDYVEEAIGTWGGQRNPDDPLFHPEKVQVINVNFRDGGKPRAD